MIENSGRQTCGQHLTSGFMAERTIWAVFFRVIQANNMFLIRGNYTVSSALAQQIGVPIC